MNSSAFKDLPPDVAHCVGELMLRAAAARDEQVRFAADAHHSMLKGLAHLSFGAWVVSVAGSSAGAIGHGYALSADGEYRNDEHKRVFTEAVVAVFRSYLTEAMKTTIVDGQPVLP